MRSEENAPKYGEPTAGFSFTTMLQHISLFGQGFPSKEQHDDSGTSPILSWSGCSRFLPVCLMKLRLKRRSFCDATEIIKNAKEEMKRLSQTGFQQYFQHLYSCYWEVYSYTSELFRRKFSLNYCNVSYFFDRMRFQEYFQVTKYSYVMRSKKVYFRRCMTKYHYFTITRRINCVRNNTPDVVAETKQ